MTAFDSPYHNYITNVEKITSRGEGLLNNIQSALAKKSNSQLSDNDKEVLQITSRSLNRRFRGHEAANLVGVTTAAIYTAEKDGKLPPPKLKENAAGVRNVRAGYTLSELNHMREVFGTLPHKADDESAVTLGFLNLKGGAWKTTLALLFGQHLATLGYRVLFVDTDPQGTLSFFMGCRPDTDCDYSDTIAPYVVGDEETINEKGFEFGSLHYAIRNTHWPNIDLIPGSLSISSIDMQLPHLISAASTIEEKQYYFQLIRNGIESVKKDYDVVIVDGTPSLNTLTMNVFSACDVAIVPCPAQMADFASTMQFFNTIGETVQFYEEGNFSIPVPDIRVLITKFATAGYADWMAKIIRQTFGDLTLHNVVKKTDEVGKKGTKMTTIYEEDLKEASNRKGIKSALDMYEKPFNEILTDVIFPFWPSKSKENIKEQSSIAKTLETEGVL
ncbi:AAA family ATPase [Spartinivicinus ruber]|uniref:AAA family ATPase n=1 Tax=Spartinivicinus ruber TaxID=2683272 RepID=UPI0013D0B6CB|nr:AAA family ATPase [Spartinivicinus ruber]